MRSIEKKHWSVVITYSGLLIVSVFVNPLWPFGRVAWNGLFQVFGPTLGTVLLTAGTLILMIGRRISAVNGIAAVALLIVVSLVCLAFTIPVMMHV